MKKIFLFILLFGLGSLSAQSFNLRLNNFVEKPKIFSSLDTLKILAVLVEFKEDNDPNTFGTGKFGSIYSKDYGDTILDPYPHDVKYFENHLEFAKNYFKKVSRGKLNISYTVLPKIITVSQIMRNYSPPPSNPNDLTNIAKLAKEVWHLADSIYSDFDFSKYNLFTIFHAGVGNAFYPQGKLGFERDLPSVYLSEVTLKSIFGDNFNGFKTKNFLIKNSIILPTTESKEIESFGEKKLYQMSINGLIVGNIASYLGLPDLFNTETGATAIDRFGLMDGNALFAYNGVFPPEPCAWEKIYLGWIKPVVIDKVDKKINIVAQLAANLNDTVVVKIPINSSEYYLVENRQRDVNRDGIKVTYKIGNSIYTFHTNKDKPRFNFSNVDTLAGVITDVDEFDWAVPGNGIVIWHIDENIIKEKISINKINADIKNKGVDIEEADGIQDIGEHFSSPIGDFYGTGSEEDFWFAENKARLYKNKFGPDTKPNTKSNSGANSLITLENFSSIGNKMSFEVKFGEDFVKPLASKQINFSNPKFISVPSNNYNASYVLDNSDLIVITKYDYEKTIINNFSENFIASANLNGIDFVLGSVENKINCLIKYPNKENLYKINLSSKITTPIIICNENNQLIAYAGSINGELVKLYIQSLFSTDGAKYEVVKIVDDEIKQICKPFENNKNYFSLITKTSFYDSDNFKLQLPNKPIFLSLLFNRTNSTFTNIVLTEQNNFYLIEKGVIIKEFKINSNERIETFSLFNDFHNGEALILVSNGNRIEAYNLNGTLQNNFPIYEPDGEKFSSSSLLTADLNGDGIVDIVAISNKGNFYAFDSKTGKALSYFPISIGKSVVLTPVLFNFLPESMSPFALQAVLIIDGEYNLLQWLIGLKNNIDSWSAKFSNSYNNSFLSFEKHQVNNGEFFPEDKVYNWPNPVYNNETFIRFFVTEDSEVKIKIFDLSGDLVDELKGYATGGYDNEIKWDVKSVQSGIYYASIEVKTYSGKSGNKVIKIAVIK
ncbi:MAG: T9SS type A sorting domain-containing protein [Melioribacter sp.]|nr:T9SS type A sorting domain-containing protein [Melioribacter sp.]